MSRVLLIDNDDSFTRNLEHCLVAATGAVPRIVRYGALGEVGPEGFDLVVISPGPGHPREYPGYGRFLDSGRAVLGVCLGLQIINAHFGGETGRLAGCVHGRADQIEFDGARRTVARYHSLHLTRLGAGLEVLARNAGGVIMAARHVTRPLLGYQFHPESFLTDDGPWYIRHALRLLDLH